MKRFVSVVVLSLLGLPGATSAADQPNILILCAADPREKNDLAAQQPEKAGPLQALWDAWNAKNEPPRWIDARWNGLEEKKAKKQIKKGKGKKNKN